MKAVQINQVHLPALLLRLALATVFFYAAFASLANPVEWIGYLPRMLTENFDANSVLKLFSVYEIALAALLLSGLHVRYVALLAAATLAGIIVTNFQNFIISFRDVGLMLAALALAATKEK